MNASSENPIYTVYAVVNGKKYELTNVVESIDLSDQMGQMAQAANITVMNVEVGGTWMTNLLKVRSRIFIYANDGSGNREVFRGYIWSRPYRASLTEREITLKCYDDLIYFLNSEDADYFSAGKSTEDVVRTLCEKWGVELDYQYESITHAKLALRGTLGDIILTDLLDQVQAQTGKKYVLLMNQGKIQIKTLGSNTTIYQLTAGTNAIRTNSDVTMEGMVTKVIIYGKAEDDDSRAPIEAIVTGDTDTYGTLQKIITRDENTSLEDAKKEAQTMIDQEGEPFWEYDICTVDIPWIRKGDLVYVNAGDIKNKYLIASDVDREISNKKKEMIITLSDPKTAEGSSSAGSNENSGAGEEALRQKVVDNMLAWLGSASHDEILKIYNGQGDLPRGYDVKSWDSWCATAVSAAFIKAGLTNIAPTECSCYYMIEEYKKLGRWEENDAYRPSTGDIIMYDWQDGGSGDNQGTPDHVGIVVSVSGSTITIIEGNNNNAVGYRTISVNDKGIRGYCLPDYSKAG